MIKILTPIIFFFSMDALASEAITAQNRAVIQDEVQHDLQEFLKNQPALPGQTKRQLISVNADPESQIIYIDLAEGYFKLEPGKAIPTEVYLGLSNLEGTVASLLKETIQYRTLLIKINGKDISEVVPGYTTSDRAEQ